MALNEQKLTSMIDGSRIKCKLPLVAEYNTSISRFRNQITAQFLRDSPRYCVVEPSSPPTQIQEEKLSETAEPLQFSSPIALDSPATKINSINAATRNVKFEIIGFGSIEALVTGETVYEIDYWGTDGQSHRQQQVEPFSKKITILGDYPTDASLTGKIVIDSLETTNEFDPSFEQINSIQTNLNLSAVMTVTALTAKPFPRPVMLSKTFHNLYLPVTIDFEHLVHHIISTHVVLRNVFFEIVDFTSLKVRVTGEAVIKVIYLGVDRTLHKQQEVAPIASVFAIAGNFPSNSRVAGYLVLERVINVPEEDPSFSAITGLTSNLFFTAVIEIWAFF